MLHFNLTGQVLHVLIHDLQQDRRIRDDDVHARLQEKVFRVQLAGERVNMIERLQLPLLVGPGLDKLLDQLGVEAFGLEPAE